MLLEKLTRQIEHLVVSMTVPSVVVVSHHDQLEVEILQYLLFLYSNYMIVVVILD
jgi:hypothetical protein